MCILLLALLLQLTSILHPDRLSAQSSSARSHEMTLLLEPIAAGVRYLHGSASGVRPGAAITVGPLEGVRLARDESGRVREWATAHAVLGVSVARGVVVLAQAGAVFAAGNDFSVFYPSGLVGLEIGGRRIRIASAVRTMRIAGAYGSGTYRVEWVPVRLGWAIPW